MEVTAPATTSDPAPQPVPASATPARQILRAGGQAAIPGSSATGASAPSSASQPAATSADMAIRPPDQDDIEATDEFVLTVKAG